VDALHQREVNQQAAVDRGASGDVMSAALDGEREAAVAAEADRVADVGGIPAARDHRRPLVDQPIVHPARVVVAGIAGVEQLAAEAEGQIGNRCVRHSAPGWSNADPIV